MCGFPPPPLGPDVLNEVGEKEVLRNHVGYPCLRYLYPFTSFRRLHFLKWYPGAISSRRTTLARTSLPSNCLMFSLREGPGAAGAKDGSDRNSFSPRPGSQSPRWRCGQDWATPEAPEQGRSPLPAPGAERTPGHIPMASPLCVCPLCVPYDDTYHWI